MKLALVFLICCGQLSAAFPTGWTRKCKLTIDHTQVPADQTGMPTLISTASLVTNCSEIMTTGNPHAAQADGGDLRITSDAAGSTRLALEVVRWVQNATPASATVELWTPTNPTHSADASIYIWYSAGGGQTQPAANAPFGSQSVWDSNYLTVYHVPDGSSLSLSDSTANANTAVNHGTATATAGQIDGGVSIVAQTKFLTAPFVSGMSALSITASCWFKTSTTGATQNLLRRDDGGSNRNFALRIETSNQVNLFVLFGSIANVQTTGTYTDGNWHYVVGIIQRSPPNTFITLVVDGVNIGTNSGLTAPPTGTTEDLYIGQFQGGGEGFTGSMDEVHYSITNRSVNWSITEFNNQNSPGTFIVAGAPITVSSMVARRTAIQ